MWSMKPLLLLLATSSLAAADADSEWCLFFYADADCKGISTAGYCNSVGTGDCMSSGGGQSVYMNFTGNYGNGVGTFTPLQAGTTCSDASPSLNLGECIAPSANNCHGLAEGENLFQFTGLEIDACTTPGGPAPDPPK